MSFSPATLTHFSSLSITQAHQLPIEILLPRRQSWRGRPGCWIERLERRLHCDATIANFGGVDAVTSGSVPQVIELNLNNGTTPPTSSTNVTDIKDPTFGQDGIATINAFDQDSAQSVVIQPDGKIVVAGWSGDRADASIGGDGAANGITLVRLNTDGSLDNSFGAPPTPGIAHVALDPSDLTVADPLPLVLQTDGSFLVGGRGVRKVSADGQFDSSFGDNGLALVPPRINLRPTDNLIQIQHQSNVTSQLTHSIVVLSDGTIVTVDERMDLHAFNPDGSTKTTFGDNGDANLGDNMPNGIRDSGQVTLDGNGKLIVVGSLERNYDARQMQSVLVRVNPDGSLDTSFGAGGYVYTGGGQSGLALSGTTVAVLPHGKILAAGAAESDGGTMLARFNPDGSLDTTFADNGIAHDTAGGYAAQGLAVDASGMIYITSSFGDHLSVARYNPNGSRDTTFADNGFAAIDVVPGYRVMEDPAGLAIQPDGNVIAVGHVQFYSEQAFNHADFFVVRLKGDGSGPAPLSQPSGNGQDDNGNTDHVANSDVVHADGSIFSNSSVASTGSNFDFDDPSGKKKDLTADPQESILP